MNFLDKLDFLLQKNKMNKRQLSQATGIPYTTIDSFYKKGYDNIKLSTLIKLSSYFQCTLDYLVDDENGNEYIEQSPNSNDTSLKEVIYKEILELSEEEQSYILDMINTYKKHLPIK